MKLILQTYDTDGCTYSSEVYTGIEAESKDDLIFAIFEAIKEQAQPILNEREAERKKHALTPNKRKPTIDNYPIRVRLMYNGQAIQVEDDFHEGNVMTLEEFWNCIKAKDKFDN